METITLSQALARAELLRPSPCDPEILTAWLEELDGKLAAELLKIQPPTYRYPEDCDTPLLVPKPYHNVYELYLTAMQDLRDRDTERYENDAALYRQALQEWKAYYRRTHVPE